MARVRTTRDTSPAGSDELRSRIITAAHELAVDGGHSSVQIREIAKRTGISSATIYKQFSSKDLLIAEMQLAWTRELKAVMPRLVGSTAAERILSLVRRACRSLERSPELGKAITLTLGSSDPEVRRCRDEEYLIWADLIRELLATEPFDTEEVIDLLSLAWSGSAFRWAHGLWSIDRMKARLERCVEIILESSRLPDGVPEGVPLRV